MRRALVRVALGAWGAGVLWGAAAALQLLGVGP